MTYYALTITGRAYGADIKAAQRTRQFWLDRNGSNGNQEFLEMVRKCHTMQEVETLTGALQMKCERFAGIMQRTFKEIQGREMSVVSLSFELPPSDNADDIDEIDADKALLQHDVLALRRQVSNLQDKIISDRAAMSTVSDTIKRLAEADRATGMIMHRDDAS